MRFNKQEVISLATQPSKTFDKEGILFIRERQDSFFRRSEKRRSLSKLTCISTQQRRTSEGSLGHLNCVGVSGKVFIERWCRLRGNLLFYFKTRDQWSEPVGVIVLEQCQIRTEPPASVGNAGTLHDNQYPFYIIFAGGLCQSLATYSEGDRVEWMNALSQASFANLRAQMLALQQCIERKPRKMRVPLSEWREKRGISLDTVELPICELSLACDNLLCDGNGRPPNPAVSVEIFLPTLKTWIDYATTETAEKCSNVIFFTTISLRASDGLTDDSIVRFIIHDVREKLSRVTIPLGQACVLLNVLKDSTRIRLPLTDRNSSGRPTVGFLTLHSWTLESEEDRNSSTENTPCRNMASISNKTQVFSHRRSQSLPPRLGVKLRFPTQAELRLLFASIYLKTYRFHSGLGGDICVYELMAESKLCFSFPQQLLSVWINREKELLQEVAAMGELREPWHSKQVDLLDRHLQLLRLYSQARENLQNYKGANFKQSSRKDDRSLEFAPINLHLQRMWVRNDTLNKSDFYDLITVGAFTAHAHKSKNGGLIKLVQQLKESPLKNNENVDASKISMAYDAVQAIKQLRREVVEAMKRLMALANQKQTQGMLVLCDQLVTKTRILLSLWDAGLVEEALNFIEEFKVVSETNADRINLDVQRPTLSLSPFKRITQQLTSLQLKSPDLDDFATPCTPSVKNVDELWRMRGLKSSNENETIENLTLDLRSLIMRNARGGETPNANAHETNQFVVYPEADTDEKHVPETIDENAGNETSVDTDSDALDERLNNNGDVDLGKTFLDTKVMTASPSANYYQPTDEPEPWDLTQLNIEASVMCLVSKVKFLCGRCGSPAVRLRNQKTITHTFRMSKLAMGETREPTNGNVANEPKQPVIDAVNSMRGANKFTQGLDLATITDWAAELRPSMRKLRQAMDGLLKTARLAHSVLRLQQDVRSAQRTCNVKYRRDVCFSQALTSLVTGLMTKFWCQKPDLIFLASLPTLGVLCVFEGLLSYYGNEIDMLGDMAVAIEDLRTVSFQLTRCPVPGSEATANNSINNNQNVPNAGVPQPKIIGTRNTLTVLLPVPDAVYSLLPAPGAQQKDITFHVTPVFFNIGINESATIAENLGTTRTQERANVDNFERLNEYYIRYKKLNLPPSAEFLCQSLQSNSCRSSYQRPLDELMTSLRAAVATSRAKNVHVLHLAAQISRAMRAIKFTSCKSAKDRTGMSVTLEQCQILAMEYHLAEHEFQRALDCMRSEGCRRENTQKNIGLRKYAFNSLQLLAYPKVYRPPFGTYGSAQT